LSRFLQNQWKGVYFLTTFRKDIKEEEKVLGQSEVSKPCLLVGKVKN
jgi:hypothetical protein